MLVLLPGSEGKAYCDARSDEKPSDTSVCSIQMEPARYDKILVRVRVRIRSDGMERIGAEDTLCPDKVVKLLVAAGGDYGVDTLRSVIFSGHPGTLDKEILSTVVGIVGNESGGRGGAVITVRRVEGIEVKFNHDMWGNSVH
jgi:hypothetical protein